MSNAMSLKLGLAIGMAAVGALAAPSCGDDAAATTETASGTTPGEICDNDADDDLDGETDCDDADCWVEGGVCEEACDSEDDEDGDGLVSCDDPDCWVDGGECAEVCDGGDDEDGDGAVDCDDSDCWVSGTSCDEICGSGEDEDGDGAVDCDDSDCWVEGGDCEEICAGADDEDGDGLVGCDDEDDCRLDAACAPSYNTDIKPIFLEHCGSDSCHTGSAPQGGWDVDNYASGLLDAYYCPDPATKAECTIVRIKDLTMPVGCEGCLDPVEEIAVIQHWVDAGTPP